MTISPTKNGNSYIAASTAQVVQKYAKKLFINNSVQLEGIIRGVLFSKMTTAN